MRSRTGLVSAIAGGECEARRPRETSSGVYATVPAAWSTTPSVPWAGPDAMARVSPSPLASVHVSAIVAGTSCATAAAVSLQTGATWRLKCSTVSVTSERCTQRLRPD